MVREGTRFVILAATVIIPLCALAEDLKARERFGRSPHNDSGDCSLCHVAPVEKLRAWYVGDSTKRLLKKDPTTLCQDCHGSGFGHGIGMKTSLNRANLPLNDDGTINCSLTCHDLHVQSEDQLQQSYYLRYPSVKLCTSCHDK